MSHTKMIQNPGGGMKRIEISMCGVIGIGKKAGHEIGSTPNPSSNKAGLTKRCSSRRCERER